jgi:hypothetical protein
MFTVAAVLPFLPLIEDAMIRQMHDSDAQKRNQAAVVLHNVMRASYAPHSREVLTKVIKAGRESGREIYAKQLNRAVTKEDTTINRGLVELKDNNQLMEFIEKPKSQFLCLYIQVKFKVERKLDKETWEELVKVCGHIIYKAEKSGMDTSGKLYIIIFPLEKIKGDDIYRIRSLDRRHGESVVHFTRIDEFMLKRIFVTRKIQERKK